MRRHIGIIIGLGLAVFGSFLAIVNPSTVSAEDISVGPVIEEKMLWASRRYASQEAFLGCLIRAPLKVNGSVVKDMVLEGRFFDLGVAGTPVPYGFVMNPGEDNGKITCESMQGTAEGQSLDMLKELGWNDPLEAICEMASTKPSGVSSCKNIPSSVARYHLPSYDSAVKAIEKNNPGINQGLPGGIKAGGQYYLSGPAKYVTTWSALSSRCSLHHDVEVLSNDHGRRKDDNSPISTKDRLVANVVMADGSVRYISYMYTNPGGSMDVYGYSDQRDSGGAFSPKNCVELSNEMNKNAQAYSTYLKALVKVKAGVNVKDTRGNSQNNNSSNGSVCIGGALGWILCPVIKTAGEAMKTLAEMLDSFMRFQPLIGSDTGEGDAVFIVWRMIVGMANLSLVAIFLVVIFSQATSVGLSAYGIKKMLPKIIIAAILINISFYLCAILVDVFNIIGASIKGIVNASMSAVKPPEITAGAPGSLGTSIIGLVELVLLGGALAVTGTVGFLLPIALSAFLSLFMLFVIVALRHVAVLLLIMVSPLAFATMVLPNTDGIFKKWWKALWTALALYPIIMALAHGSMLVSRILLGTVKGSEGVPDSAIGWFITGIALLVTVVWVFALKFIVSWGAGFIGRLGGMINDKNRGLIDRANKWAGQKQENSTFGQIMSNRKAAVNANAQRRGYQRMSKGLIGKVSTLGMSGGASQLMQAQTDEANTKIHAQQVAFAKQDISRRYNASDPNHRSSMAREAIAAARNGDQIRLDAIMSHAATTGADEFADVYNQVQDGIGESELRNTDGKISRALGQSNLYISANHGAELGQKNRGLATLLQTGNPVPRIEDAMHDDGMRTFFQRASAEKAVSWSSDTARAAAQYLDEDVLMKAVYDPNTNKGAGTSVLAAYRDELAARLGYGGDGKKVSQGHPADPSSGTAASKSRRASDPNVRGRGASLPKTLDELRKREEEKREKESTPEPTPTDGDDYSI